MEQKRYQHQEIEAKWQERWEQQPELSRAQDGGAKPKLYTLIEFPYPSADGLHTGHMRSYTAFDIIARKKRMEGYNVLFPIGFDAFGLPAENYAIKTGTHPSVRTRKNIENFTRQLKAAGFSFDWSRVVDTTDPAYYKWTQWIFLQFFKHNLAYKAKMDINWCPKDNCGLANEEVVNGACERCGTPVVRKEKEQWMLKITAYADKLVDGLANVDFWEKIKKQQIDWIGRSTGAQIAFRVGSTRTLPDDEPYHLAVYTTRPDTLFGATYMVVAPEHEIIDRFADHIANIGEVREYRDLAKHKSELERTSMEKVKTGVELHGLTAINPANGERIPVFTSDYVLGTYGTGAIMAVPAHDARDYAFAKKFGLPIVEVIDGGDIETQAWEGEGVAINSGFLNGMLASAAKARMIEWVAQQGIGFEKTQYHLRDWVFSRQRYWGEPIPIIICKHCGYVPVPEHDLPVVLPQVEKYETTTTGESPLSAITEWVEVPCPKCGADARRETDTMPQWAGSSWYFLRYTDPHNDTAFAAPEKLKYWMPVDWYNGGMEHTTLHLLYSRFWHQFLYDIGVVPTPEPYAKRTSHGLVLADGGEKMSKSKGNVVSPDTVISKYGADSLRLFEMFMGPFDQPTPWSENGLIGVRRFIEKAWDVAAKLETAARPREDHVVRATHKTLAKLTKQIDSLDFNTCVSAFMILVNTYAKDGCTTELFELFLKMFAPFAPHVAEELWEQLGHTTSIFLEPWPQADAELVRDFFIQLPVQVNGKVRGKITATEDQSDDEITQAALADPAVQKWTQTGTVQKVVYVRGRIVNIIVS